MGVSRADMCRVGVQGVRLTQPGRCSSEPLMAHALKPGNTRRAMAGSDAGVVSVQWQDALGRPQVSCLPAVFDCTSAWVESAVRRS